MSRQSNFSLTIDSLPNWYTELGILEIASDPMAYHTYENGLKVDNISWAFRFEYVDNWAEIIPLLINLEKAIFAQTVWAGQFQKAEGQSSLKRDFEHFKLRLSRKQCLKLEPCPQRLVKVGLSPTNTKVYFQKRQPWTVNYLEDSGKRLISFYARFAFCLYS